MELRVAQQSVVTWSEVGGSTEDSGVWRGWRQHSRGRWGGMKSRTAQQSVVVWSVMGDGTAEDSGVEWTWGQCS